MICWFDLYLIKIHLTISNETQRFEIDISDVAIVCRKTSRINNIKRKSSNRVDLKLLLIIHKHIRDDSNSKEPLFIVLCLFTVLPYIDVSFRTTWEWKYLLLCSVNNYDGVHFKPIGTITKIFIQQIGFSPFLLSAEWTFSYWKLFYNFSVKLTTKEISAFLISLPTELRLVH